MDTVGEVEGGMNWEIRFDINTLPCVKEMAKGRLLNSTGSSALCSVMIQKDGMGGHGVKVRLKVEGLYVYLKLIHIIVGRKQHNIVEQLSSN